MTYNPEFLENIDIFSSSELKSLDSMQKEMNLKYFIESKTLIEKFGFDFIYSSAQIEGNTYNKADTLSLLEEGFTAGGKKYSDAIMILNLRNVYNTIMLNEIDINRISLHNIHSIIAKDLVQSRNLGTMRLSNIDGITGSAYIPLPSGERLYDEMRFLLENANNINNPFNKALYLHNNIAYLQYFEDCNKRTARTMQFVSLKNDGIMPLVLINDNKVMYKIYRHALIDYYENGNYATMKDFFINNYEILHNHFAEIKLAKEKQQSLNKTKSISKTKKPKKDYGIEM